MFTTVTAYKAMRDYQKARGKFEINPESKDGLRWIENISTGWRFAGFADEIVNLNHTGWFTDEDGDRETLRGVVYQLPTRKDGTQVFAVGYADPWNDDCARVQIITGYDKDDAAHQADNIAERAAEDERDYQRAFSLGTQYAETGDSIAEARAEHSQIIKELKTLRGTLTGDTPGICKALRARLSKLRRDVRQAIETRREIAKNHHFRDKLEAFLDGAGITSEDAKAQGIS